MGRRRKKGRKVHGWLVLDKPYDFGSTEAVGKLRWLFEAQKVGHGGTLDPLATGILPIAFGEATKTIPFIQDGLKTYRFTACWGEGRDSDDREGAIIARSDKRPDRAAIEAVLPSFTGDIEQIPPSFSAIKIDGERAYDLARDGAPPQLQARPVHIYSLQLVDIPDADHAVFEAVTGKGTYVRALVRDMAEALGTCGHVAGLRRTRVGPFGEDMAVDFAQMTGNEMADVPREAVDPEGLVDFLLPIEAALADYPSVSLGGVETQKLQRGQSVVLAPPVASGVRGDLRGEVPVVVAMAHEEAIGVCSLDGLTLKPSRIFVR